MDELSVVIEGLRQCFMDDRTEAYETQCEDCPYFDPDVTVRECKFTLRDDAIELLKNPYLPSEKAPVKPKKIANRTDNTPVYACRACNREIGVGDKYCKHCGRKVRWE